MSFLQNIYSVIFRPGQAFAQLANNYSSGLILQALLLVIIIAAIQEEPSLAGLLAYSSSWLIASSLIFLIAFIFKLEAREYPRFMTLLAFANIPLIFLAPTSLINDFNSAFGILIKLAILIWTFSLNITALAEIAGISKFKAALIYSLPAIAVALFLFKFLLSAISQLVLLLF